MVLILLLYFSLSPQNDYKIAITNRKKHCKTRQKRQISHRIKKIKK